MGHGPGGRAHARRHRFGIAVASADIGEDQQGMLVERPVGTQLLVEAGGQGDDAILVALAAADPQFVFAAEDVVDGQAQAFAQAQAAGINELEGRAIAAQADRGQQSVDLLTGEHGGQGVMVFGADLREDQPVGVPQLVDEEHACRSAGLVNGLGLPMLAQLDHEEVVAQLGLGERKRIGAEMLVNQPQLAVIRVSGAIGVVTQGQQLSEASH